MKQRGLQTMAAGVAAACMSFILSPNTALCQAPAATALAALRQVQEEGKYAFVVFTKGSGVARGLLGGRAAEDMVATAQTAAAQTSGKAEFIEVNVTDPAQAEMVRQFDVSRAPMPMALVVAPNGAVMGAHPKRVDAAALTGAMAGPGMQRCMKALQDRHLVLLCVQNDQTQNNEAAMKGVMEFKADSRWKEATDVVKLDPDNPDDAKWLPKFQVDTSDRQAVTVFLAPPGTPLGTYRGATSKAALVAKLQTASSACASGCGPGGCGPAKQ